MTFVVAIDGPAAAGKGTIARAVARAFGFDHLDTGMLYRAVAKKALEVGGGTVRDDVAIAAARELRAEEVADRGLRGKEVGQAASQVAAIPEVRAALLDFQRRFGEGRGAVLDGRDIGTVVCPDADVKLYVTASDEVRAERRWRELSAADPAITLEDVAADLKARDERDARRESAPMALAPDAHLLDTSELDIDAAVAEAVALVRSKHTA